MLDRLHSGAQGGHDSGFTMTMSGNNAIGAARLFHNRPHLFITELLMNGMVDLAHHSARGADFDHAGAEPQLAAHLMKARRYAIAKSEDRLGRFRDMKHIERKSVNVAVAAR